MASLDERVANLEAQTDKHAVAVAALRGDIGDLRVDLRTEIAALRGDMATLRGDMALRSETVELRRELAATRGEMATRTDVADLRREMGDLRSEMNRRFDLMDQKFVWVVGIMVSGFIAVIGALVGVVYLQMMST